MGTGSLKETVRQKALDMGFDDIGFTGIEPFDLYVREIQSRSAMYDWLNTESFNTIRGASPVQKHPWARAIVVLIRSYHKNRFPKELVGKYGRIYQVDERKIRGEEYHRFLGFLDFLKKQGIESKYDGEIPARIAASRAGIATYGKNCFVYARKSMNQASWLESLVMVTDADFEPDTSSLEVACPPDCEMRCMKACPTGALYEPLRMNPGKCVAYLSYYGQELTPRELREPMGTWMYGCDRCQEACPRNRELMKKELPFNEELQTRMADFDLSVLLRMSQDYYENIVWPQFFYMPKERLDRWQMNAARALGNLRDPDSVQVLSEALAENPFENVRAMAAWALGQIGGQKARSALEARREQSQGVVKQEIDLALDEHWR